MLKLSDCKCSPRGNCCFTRVSVQGGEALRAVALPAAYLFLLIMHREILMDINDTKGDGEMGVQTIPVVFGRDAALTAAAALCAAASAIALQAAAAGSLWAVRPFLCLLCVSALQRALCACPSGRVNVIKGPGYGLHLKSVVFSTIPDDTGGTIVAALCQGPAVCAESRCDCSTPGSHYRDLSQPVPEDSGQGCNRGVHEVHRLRLSANGVPGLTLAPCMTHSVERAEGTPILATRQSQWIRFMVKTTLSCL